MSRVFHLLSIFSLSLATQAQTYDYSIGRQTEQVDSFRYWLQELVDLGVRQSGNEELNDARDWIVEKYMHFGFSSIKLDTFSYAGSELYNIIIEKPGLDTNKWIIVGAHYDSKNGPGANDNGSGIVACLEIAKAIAQIETRVGIRFIHFSAEEQGLKGSNHYVYETLDPEEEILLMINLDQLGGTKGETEDNARIECEADLGGIIGNNEASAKYTDTLEILVSLYSFLEPVRSQAFASDYLSFEELGYVITGMYQHSNYPYTHSSQDIIENMDLDALQEVIKAAMAAVFYFSRNTLPLSIADPAITPIHLYPNPNKGRFIIKGLQAGTLIEIMDASGRLLVRKYLDESQQVDLALLPAGYYTVKVYDHQNGVIRFAKLIIAAE